MADSRICEESKGKGTMSISRSRRADYQKRHYLERGYLREVPWHSYWREKMNNGNDGLRKWSEMGRCLRESDGRPDEGMEERCKKRVNRIWLHFIFYFLFWPATPLCPLRLYILLLPLSFPVIILLSFIAFSWQIG